MTKFNEEMNQSKVIKINETELKRITQLVLEELSDDVTFDDLQSLKKIKNRVQREEVINWFNENDIEYFYMNDMEMYIMYIEKNMEDSEDLGSVEETNFIPDDLLNEAEYQGRKVQLGKPFLTPDGPKKRSVYVKNDKGNVVKVNFGDPNMRIKKNIPSRRKSFRARHHCENPGPKWKPRYWSCKFW
jgi:hypothetical protein